MGGWEQVPGGAQLAGRQPACVARSRVAPPPLAAEDETVLGPASAFPPPPPLPAGSSPLLPSPPPPAPPSSPPLLPTRSTPPPSPLPHSFLLGPPPTPLGRILRGKACPGRHCLAVHRPRAAGVPQRGIRRALSPAAPGTDPPSHHYRNPALQLPPPPILPSH